MVAFMLCCATIKSPIYFMHTGTKTIISHKIEYKAVENPQHFYFTGFGALSC